MLLRCVCSEMNSPEGTKENQHMVGLAPKHFLLKCSSLVLQILLLVSWLFSHFLSQKSLLFLLIGKSRLYCCLLVVQLSLELGSVLNICNLILNPHNFFLALST